MSSKKETPPNWNWEFDYRTTWNSAVDTPEPEGKQKKRQEKRKKIENALEMVNRISSNPLFAEKYPKDLTDKISAEAEEKIQKIRKKEQIRSNSEHMQSFHRRNKNESTTKSGKPREYHVPKRIVSKYPEWVYENTKRSNWDQKQIDLDESKDPKDQARAQKRKRKIETAIKANKKIYKKK